MENNPPKGNKTNKTNKLCSQDFDSIYIKQDNLTDSQETIMPNSKNGTIKIKVENDDEKETYRKKFFGIDKIDYFYKFSNEIKKQENIGIPLDIEIEKKDDFETDFISDICDESIYINMDKFRNRKFI